MLIQTARDQVQNLSWGQNVRKKFTYQSELQNVGHGLSHKEILQLAEETDSKRVTQVLKNTLPSEL
jgi:hypothetical protein